MERKPEDKRERGGNVWMTSIANNVNEIYEKIKIQY